MANALPFCRRGGLPAKHGGQLESLRRLERGRPLGKTRGRRQNAGLLNHASGRAEELSGALPKADKADKTYRDTMVLAWQLGGPSSERQKNICLSQTWLDLTAKMSSDGRLAWEAPKGNG